mmetsp:Transcript_46452/g.109933  ORF Transcript_46452/g.109933 Transcript_46452/m.109933 type:complete len:245 (-) Transcript_46452:14-748(-)
MAVRKTPLTAHPIMTLSLSLTMPSNPWNCTCVNPRTEIWFFLLKSSIASLGKPCSSWKFHGSWLTGIAPFGLHGAQSFCSCARHAATTLSSSHRPSASHPTVIENPPTGASVAPTSPKPTAKKHVSGILPDPVLLDLNSCWWLPKIPRVVFVTGEGMNATTPLTNSIDSGNPCNSLTVLSFVVALSCSTVGQWKPRAQPDRSAPKRIANQYVGCPTSHLVSAGLAIVLTANDANIRKNTTDGNA